MNRAQGESLLSCTQAFFQSYLRQTRGASVHTVRAYRDALKLFFLFLAEHAGRPIASLTLDDVRANAVLAFLEHIETRRGNSAITRNCRLAALRSFVQYLLRNDVTRAGQYGAILAIRTKRATRRTVTYLEPEEARALIAAIDVRARHGDRDRALLLFLYNTGARVAEALALRPSALRLERPRQVRVLGKGSKERICPLWPETAAALRRIIRFDTSDEPLFRNGAGGPLSRDGVALLLQKYAGIAANQRPSLRKRHITPHVLRHSCACALLQAGVDITVIRDYLGHSSVATTSRYVTTNLQMKRDALEAFWKRAGLEPAGSRKWRPSPQLLTFLETL
ncbi:MAG TPA: site-specific integrase [Bryobacteraceae bacterium]|jgi:site-specific recombinase XerD